MHYATDTVESVAFAMGVLAGIYKGIQTAMKILNRAFQAEEQVALDAADGAEIEAAAGEELADNLPDAFFEADIVALDLVEVQLDIDISLMAIIGPIAGLVVVVVIAIFIVLCCIYYLWTLVDRSYCSRHLIFNASQTKLELSNLYMDNVDTTKKHFPSILEEGSKTSKIICGVGSAPSPFPDGGHTIPDEPVIHYVMYSLVNDSKILEGLGSLIGLKPKAKSEVNENSFTDSYWKYEIHRLKDNEQDINLNNTSIKYESVYNDMGKQKKYIARDTNSLSFIQATSLLSGSDNDTYDVVSIIYDKDVPF